MTLGVRPLLLLDSGIGAHYSISSLKGMPSKDRTPNIDAEMRLSDSFIVYAV